jgi:hypothetical protein
LCKTVNSSFCFVLVVMTPPGRSLRPALGGVFPSLPAVQWCQVEEGPDGGQHFVATARGELGAKDVVAIAKRTLVPEPSLSLWVTPKSTWKSSFRRREPGDRPTHSLFVLQDVLYWRRIRRPYRREPIGKRRRSAARASCARVAAFSLTRSFWRATCHSASETICGTQTLADDATGSRLFIRYFKNEARSNRAPNFAPSYFLAFCVSNTSGCASGDLTAGFVYGFFISAPQQHLGLNTASAGGSITSISQRQSGLIQR